MAAWQLHSLDLASSGRKRWRPTNLTGGSIGGRRWRLPPSPLPFRPPKRIANCDNTASVTTGVSWLCFFHPSPWTLQARQGVACQSAVSTYLFFPLLDLHSWDRVVARPYISSGPRPQPNLQKSARSPSRLLVNTDRGSNGTTTYPNKTVWFRGPFLNTLLLQHIDIATPHL